MSKRNRHNRNQAEEPQVELTQPTEAAAPDTTEVPVDITTEDQLAAEAEAAAADEAREKALAERQAEHDILGSDTPAVTDTPKAKGNRRFTVGSAVDTTTFGLVAGNEPKARPNTLAGALYDELKVNGPGTCSELVDRLNRDGVYERVALKSATLRPYSSVMYWLKTWRADGHVAVIIEAASTEQVA